MFPLVDKPAIQYVVEEAVVSGIEHIVIVTGKGKSAIEDHFDVSNKLEKALVGRGKNKLLKQVQEISNLATISYVCQKEALGLGHAVLVAKHLVGNEPFAVLLADDIIDARVPCTLQMARVFHQFGTSVLATQVVQGPEISQYGVIEGKPLDKGGEVSKTFNVRNLVEKPSLADAPSNLAIIGRYILTAEIFEILEKTPPDQGGEIQLTHGLRQLLKEQAIYAHCFEGKRFDAGDKLGFLKATVEFALKREDLGQAFSDYLRALPLDTDVASLGRKSNRTICKGE